MHLLYSFSFKRTLLASGFCLLLLFLFTKSTHAASLSSASATLTTSRPSPSTPLNGTYTSGDGQATVFNSITTLGSRFLASDSATLVHDFLNKTGRTILKSDFNVASQSGDLLTVYFTNSLAARAGAGADVLYVPITSMHKVQFTVNTTVPAGGKIIFTYPGSGDNSASPSATTFAFNGLTSANAAANISYKLNSGGTATCTSFTVTAPSITCTTTGATIPAGSLVTFLIGCTDAGTNTSSCAAQSPRLINPTKAAIAGNADIWKIGIETQDGSSVRLDNSTIAIGTIESVTVRATIDPSLSFTIAGITSGAVNQNNTSGCLQTETVNSGIGSTATEVGLGSLSVVPTTNDVKIGNIAAQTLSVTTNGANGYSITATSSGHLRNPSNGFFLNDSFTPLAFPTTGHFFGFHACGVDTDQLKWNSTAAVLACNTYRATSTAPICLYGWPTSTAPMLIAQDTSGPIGNGVPAGNGIVSMSYAATQDVTLPPGEYQTVVTYVATPSF